MSDIGRGAFAANPPQAGDHAGQDVSANSYSASVGSGSDAFKATVNGARFHVGAGASDYFSSDGTTISFAGPISVPQGTRLNWDGTTAGVSAFATDANTLQFDNEITHIMGTSASGPAALGGVAKADSTGVGNVGASGPDDLITYSLPANALVVTNRGLRIRAWGTTANNANAKTVALVFGSQTLITKQLTVSVAGTWEIEATVLRTGTGAQDIYVKAFNNNGSTVASADGATVYAQAAFVAGTQTETAGITIKGQSTASTSNNDVVQEGLLVEYL